MTDQNKELTVNERNTLIKSKFFEMRKQGYKESVIYAKLADMFGLSHEYVRIIRFSKTTEEVKS